MVVLSQPLLDHLSLMRTCKRTTMFTDIPEIDLSDPSAKSHIVKACEEFGFFKVINHGVSMDLINTLEEQALNFFKLPQFEKDKVRPPDPFGYGNKNIGLNGDKGWIEYILLNTNPLHISPEIDELFRSSLKNYVSSLRKLACEVVEKITEGLEIEPRNAVSKFLSDEKSDSCFRINHYPPCPELQALNGEQSLIGFGEHTDPQIISLLRSNNSTGLQICLRDGTWVSVPPDQTSFFINVGDALQVMSNGRFKSVKHKVLVTDTKRERISMIYFGGPGLNEKIEALPSLLKEGEEESLYREFTWKEYKTSAYKTKLADYRLGLFEKKKKKK